MQTNEMAVSQRDDQVVTNSFGRRNNRIAMCGAPIDNVSMNEAIESIETLINERHAAMVVTPNVDHIVKLQRDAELNNIYQKADLILPDGMPILWGAFFLGTPLKEKVSGSDLFLKLCEMSSKRGYRLFFLGGRPTAAVKAAKALQTLYPNLNICGIYSPPLGFEQDQHENKRIIAMINESQPDILFAGLGCPKQEKWIYIHKNACQVPVSIGIGASFEFVAGLVKRAPVWMRQAGLEWFWRFLQEPKRLWRRYFIEDMSYFWLLLKQKMRVANRSSLNKFSHRR